MVRLADTVLDKVGTKWNRTEVTPWLNAQRGVRQRRHDMDVTIFQQMNDSLFLMYGVVLVATLSFQLRRSKMKLQSGWVSRMALK